MEIRAILEENRKVRNRYFLCLEKDNAEKCELVYFTEPIFVIILIPYVDKISRGFNFADDEDFQFRVDLISRLRPS